MKPVIKHSVLVVLALNLLLVCNGCDYSSKSDVRRAEKAMKAADAAKADFWAEREYRAAQMAFEEAMELSAQRKVNEARDKAIEAIGRAQEATELALKRAAEMEAEQDKLGTYKN